MPALHTIHTPRQAPAPYPTPSEWQASSPAKRFVQTRPIAAGRSATVAPTAPRVC